MECDGATGSPSLREKIFCCFGHCQRTESLSLEDGKRNGRLERCNSVGSQPSCSVNDVKEKCKNLMSRIGARNGHRRNYHSADFRYDALSYALNFDEGLDENLDELPLKGFNARLPATPPRPQKAATTSKQTDSLI